MNDLNFKQPVTSSNGEKIICDSCGNPTFKPVFFLEKFSKILMAADRDQVVPLQVFGCDKCGHVNNYFLPKDYLDEKKPIE